MTGPDTVTGAAAAVAAIEAAIRATLGRSIGPDENFFDAGLTSVTLVRVHVDGTRTLDRPPPVTALFAHPNLRALRGFLAAGAPEIPGEVRAGRTEGRGMRTTAAARRESRRRTRTDGGWT